MKLKQAQRSAAVAWGPTNETSSYLASGTVAGSVDASFGVTGTFEILDVGLNDSNSEIKPLGSSESAEKFYSVAWGRLGAEAAYPWGCVAGGLADGTLNLWDAHGVANGSNTAPIASVKQHDGPIHGLEWNHTLPNLLASGAADGKVFIWDFTSANTPRVFSPGPPNAQSVGDITCVAWNRKVEYVLASASAGGAAVVWDLKAKRSVVAFGDPARRMRPSCVSWSPVDQMTLVVASSADDYPIVQVWDLRNARSPLRELKGHNSGILSSSWCLSDESMLLTSSKDRNVNCWNPSTGEYLCTVATAENDIYDVQWSPKHPALFSCCSFDGQTAVHTMTGHVTPADGAGIGGIGVSANVPQATGAPPPKWLQRPCGATFGFGGRLVTFNSAPGKRKSKLSLSTVVDDEQLYSRFTQMQNAIQTNQLPSYCATRAAEPQNTAEEADAWAFLRVLMEQEPRHQLLTHLNFDSASIPKLPEVAPAPGVDVPPPAVAEALPVEEPAPEELAALPEFETAQDMFGGGSSSFGAGESDFGAVLDQQAPLEMPTVMDAVGEVPAQPVMPINDITRVLTLPAVAALHGNDEIVTRALIAADMEAAVEACFAAGNSADALVIASIDGRGSDLFNRTIRRYLEQQQEKPYISIASAVVDRDFGALIRGTTRESWKEVLALLCTYVKDAEFEPLCNDLAMHMEGLGLTDAAVSCYMCCANVEKVVEYWSRSIESDGTVDPLRVQSFVERTMVFLHTKATPAGPPAQAAAHFSKYAQMLVSVGQLEEAMKYMVPSNTPSEMELQFRIFQALPSTSQPSFQAPQYPFDVQASLDAMEVATQQQAYAAQQEAQQAEYAAQQAAQQADYARQQAEQAAQLAAQQAEYERQQAAWAAQQATQQHPVQQVIQPHTTPVQAGWQAQAQPVQAHPAAWTQPTQQPVVASTTPQWGAPAPGPAPVAAATTPQWGTAPVAPVAAAGNAGQWGAPAAGTPAAAPVMPPITPQAVAPAATGQWGAAPTAQPPAWQPSNTPVHHAPVQAPVPAPAPAPAPVDPKLLQMGGFIKMALTNILQRCQQNPADKRKTDDISSKLDRLFGALDAGSVSAVVVGKVQAVCELSNGGDFNGAGKMLASMTKDHFGEISAWGPSVSRLMKMGQATYR